MRCIRLVFVISLTFYPTVSIAFGSLWPQLCHQYRQTQRIYIRPLHAKKKNVEHNPPKRKNLKWEESYQLLCEYKQIHDNCNVPQSQKPLGTFVNRQRIEHARFMDPNRNITTPMTSERKQLLEDIGFVWDITEHTWNIRYNELCQFRKMNGHAVVPRSHGPLGAWVEKQRIEYKKFKTLSDDDNIEAQKPSTTLTKERVEKLNEVGFVYDVREKQFEENVGALRIFREAKGHIDPRYMNGKLSFWVRKMKQQYRKYLDAKSAHPSNSTILSEILPETRLKALEDVGFKPGMFKEPQEPDKTHHRATWEERYEELVQFKKANGHCVVPKNYGSLGSWVRAQRHSMKKNGCIAPDRMALLEELDFVWDVHQWQWNQTYHELLEYKSAHGHTNVPMSQGALGLWVSNQRAHYSSYRQGKQSHMTQHRAEQLRDIDFEFYSGKKLQSAADEKWYLRFIELKRYKDAHGTCNVKRSANVSLYNWCQHQKRSYREKMQGKQSPLKKSREEALQSIGFLDEITIETFH